MMKVMRSLFLQRAVFLPRRRLPKAKIITYKQLKTASGGGASSGGGGGFYAGQDLVCKIVKDEPGGYTVTVLPSGLAGFLPTQALLRTGEEVLGQFVCVHNHRILLSARFTDRVTKPEGTRREVSANENEVARSTSSEAEIAVNENSVLKSAHSLRCSFCHKKQNEVEKLIAGLAVYICNECVQSCNDPVARESMFAPLTTVQKPPAKCTFCGKTDHTVAWIASRNNIHICDECIDLCNEILEDESELSCAACNVSADWNHLSKWPGTTNEFICRECTKKLVCTGSEEICACANCGVMTKDRCSLSNAAAPSKLCSECVEFFKETVRGKEVGPDFIWAAQCPDLSRPDLLSDSPHINELKECSFCVKADETCCELFPGSPSQICIECYGIFKAATSAVTNGCTCCKHSVDRIVGPGFALCGKCVNDLMTALESNAAHSRVCSMCNCTNKCAIFGDFALCGACLKQIRLINDLPELRPKLGEILTCRIIGPDQGGYKVHVGLGTQPGFLATRAKLRRGTIVTAEFFCWFDKKILLSPASRQAADPLRSSR